MMFYGLADWVFKRAAASGVQAHHFLALQALFFAPGIFLYGLTTNTLALGPPFAWGMMAGVLMFVALYNFARSLASGSAVAATHSCGVMSSKVLARSSSMENPVSSANAGFGITVRANVRGGDSTGWGVGWAALHTTVAPILGC